MILYFTWHYSDVVWRSRKDERVALIHSFTKSISLLGGGLRWSYNMSVSSPSFPMILCFILHYSNVVWRFQRDERVVPIHSFAKSTSLSGGGLRWTHNMLVSSHSFSIILYFIWPYSNVVQRSLRDERVAPINSFAKSTSLSGGCLRSTSNMSVSSYSFSIILYFIWPYYDAVWRSQKDERAAPIRSFAKSLSLSGGGLRLTSSMSVSSH